MSGRVDVLDICTTNQLDVNKIDQDRTQVYEHVWTVIVEHKKPFFCVIQMNMIDLALATFPHGSFLGFFGPNTTPSSEKTRLDAFNSRIHIRWGSMI